MPPSLENNELGARPSDQALVSDQAATRLAPSGFDPSRGYDSAIVVFQSAAWLLWRAIQADHQCDFFECVFRDGGNCQCMDTYSAIAAQAIDARSGETEGLDPKGESAVPTACAQGDPA